MTADEKVKAKLNEANKAKEHTSAIKQLLSNYGKVNMGRLEGSLKFKSPSKNNLLRAGKEMDQFATKNKLKDSGWSWGDGEFSGYFDLTNDVERILEDPKFKKNSTIHFGWNY